MPLRSRAGLCAGELHDVSPVWNVAACDTQTWTGENEHTQMASNHSGELVRHCREEGLLCTQGDLENDACSSNRWVRLCAQRREGEARLVMCAGELLVGSCRNRLAASQDHLAPSSLAGIASLSDATLMPRVRAVAARVPAGGTSLSAARAGNRSILHHKMLPGAFPFPA